MFFVASAEICRILKSAKVSNFGNAFIGISQKNIRNTYAIYSLILNGRNGSYSLKYTTEVIFADVAKRSEPVHAYFLSVIVLDFFQCRIYRFI